MFRFEELEIWRLAVDYGRDCYKIAEMFPRYETFGLGDQLRRAAISISNNIAEGSVGSSVSFKRYLNISIGSVLETVNILNFSIAVGYISSKDKNDMYQKAELPIKKIRSFKNSLK